MQSYFFVKNKSKNSICFYVRLSVRVRGNRRAPEREARDESTAHCPLPTAHSLSALDPDHRIPDGDDDLIVGLVDADGAAPAHLDVGIPDAAGVPDRVWAGAGHRWERGERSGAGCGTLDRASFRARRVFGAGEGGTELGEPAILFGLFTIEPRHVFA